MYSVLIVEDDPMVAMINEKYINRHGGFSVSAVCRNGAEALQALENGGIDLVVMDMYMPVMTGLETLRRIRESHINTSVIMVTAANDSASVEECLRLGVVDYLVKPFTCDRLHTALNKFKNLAETLSSGANLSQAGIDRLISGYTQGIELPKGIQSKTLDIIAECLQLFGEQGTTGDEIAASTGLSSVTVRRYLTYLVSTGKASGEMNYETGGRPSMVYRVAKSKQNPVL